MADQDNTRNDTRSASPDSARGREGEIRAPRPENAAQDPQAAARQEQVQRDSDALRDSARRVEATTPDSVRDRSVQDITRDIERNADRTNGGQR